MLLQLENPATGVVGQPMGRMHKGSSSSRPSFSYHGPSLQSLYDWAPSAPALTRQQQFPLQIHQKRSSYSSTLGLGWKPSPTLGGDDCRVDPAFLPPSRALKGDSKEADEKLLNAAAFAQQPNCPRWDLKERKKADNFVWQGRTMQQLTAFRKGHSGEAATAGSWG